MKHICELCKSSEASVHVRQVVDGIAREMHVCEECATANGFDVHAPLPLANLLMGIGIDPKPAVSAPADDPACKVCRMKRSEFKKRSRLGCPSCYDAFKADLAPMLIEMHGGVQHIGKSPSGQKAAAQIAVCEAELKAAVEAQDFEKAAELRDAIKAMSAPKETVAAEGSAGR